MVLTLHVILYELNPLKINYGLPKKKKKKKKKKKMITVAAENNDAYNDAYFA